MQDLVSAPRSAPFPHHRTARWLTRAEVAERLRVSETTVARLAATGDLEEVRMSPRSPRINPASVEQHLTRNGARSVAQEVSAA